MQIIKPFLRNCFCSMTLINSGKQCMSKNLSILEKKIPCCQCKTQCYTINAVYNTNYRGILSQFVMYETNSFYLNVTSKGNFEILRKIFPTENVKQITNKSWRRYVNFPGLYILNVGVCKCFKCWEKQLLQLSMVLWIIYHMSISLTSFILFKGQKKVGLNLTMSYVILLCPYRALSIVIPLPANQIGKEIFIVACRCISWEVWPISLGDVASYHRQEK